MSAPLTSDPEYLNFLDGQLEDHLLDQDEINSQYQDFCDGQRDAYLDELEAGE